MTNSDILYGFVMKGILTDTSLDKTKRLKRKKFTNEEHQYIIDCLSINELDEELVRQAQRMAIVYAAISAFENTVRRFIANLLIESYGEFWWDKHVSENIKKRAESRKADEQKVKWHTPRGNELMNYIDFSDLYLVIRNNWPIFEPFFNSQEWTDYILKTIERSRNVIMHSGDLASQDMIRVGQAISDWVKQVGT